MKSAPIRRFQFGLRSLFLTLTLMILLWRVYSVWTPEPISITEDEMPIPMLSGRPISP